MANGTANPTMARLGLSQFFALLLHARKTLALTAAVLGDMRVHWFSKAMYISGIGAVLLALLFPETIVDVTAAVGLPGVGILLDGLGLPVDATVDWVAVAVAAFNLLKLFPPEIVGEHYDRLFRSNGRGRA